MQKAKPHISVVTPVYGIPGAITELYERLVKALEKIDKNFEIIMVNDASPDNSWHIIQEIAKKDSRLIGLNLSRNFGQHEAITAGIDISQGEWLVVMDCDLQDLPEEINNLYKALEPEYDMVIAKRANRNHSIFHVFCSRIFYILMNYLTDKKFDPDISSFGIYNRKVIEVYKQYNEKHRSFGMIINLLGFARKIINVEHGKRGDNNGSSYSFMKKAKLATSIIVAHSNKPLYLSIGFGFFLFSYNMLYIIWLLIKYFTYGAIVTGWTSLMISLYAIGGLLFINIGILGLYIGKIFNEVKDRPLYIVKDSLNLKNQEEE